MLRGLPISLIVHLAVLGFLATWGGLVPKRVMVPERVFKVRMASLPEAEPQVQPVVSPPADDLQPETKTPTVEPVPPPPKDPVLEPKEVPQEHPEEPEADPEPEPVLIPAEPERREEPDLATEVPAPSPVDSAAVVQPLAQGPAASGTDVDFPFAWYLNRVESNIARKWQPRQLGFRAGSERSCVVHFVIGRGGQVTGVTLVRSSGVSLFDREALRAVKASRLPPLPAKFSHPSLGVTFVFTLQSGV